MYSTVRSTKFILRKCAVMCQRNLSSSAKSVLWFVASKHASGSWSDVRPFSRPAVAGACRGACPLNNRPELCRSWRHFASDEGTGKKLPKIYTRTGDKGTSVTIAGDRRPKNDDVFDALGATDELSSAIGLARVFIQEANLKECDKQLEEIQCILQDAGSNIATPRSLASPNQIAMTEFNESTVDMLEQWIDELTSTLPPLRNFILPSGGKASSSLHLARSICRRAERKITPLARMNEIDPAVAKFINRLSDYLFTLARHAAQQEGQEETIYRRVKPKKNKTS